MGKKRRHVEGETRLLMDYLQERYPADQWLTNVKVGTAIQPKVGLELTDAERRMFQVYQRFPDAVVITPHELVVIEATMHLPTEKVGRLLEYLLIVPHTAELKPYLNRRLVGELVTAQADAIAEKVARDHGLRYVVYTPPWLDDYFAIYPQRYRRAPAPGTIEL